jgi:exodeoxyribonuclease VII large subunit
VAGALRTLSQAGVELICLVRGGGAKADLAAFDSAGIARAIAGCATPVWTGIGHTGDESVADLVANQRHITPTACGVAVAEQALRCWTRVAEAARRIGSSATALLGAETSRHAELRTALAAAAAACLREHGRSLHYARSRLLAAPASTLARATESVGQRSSRLAPAAAARLATVGAELEGRRRLLGAYDPRRSLERGWTLTLDADGRILRSVEDVPDGAMITTRMVDGLLRSSVIDRERREEA